ncbi:MAG: hypothetical protein QXO50_04090 [Candidatus Bathyarchaeia archaeon]
MLGAITRHLKRLNKDKRGVSNVLVVMLSLILITVIVANVVLWNYQMNQLDIERMHESISITNASRITRSRWFTAQNEFSIVKGSNISGSYTNTKAIDGFYESFSDELLLIDNEDFVDQQSNVDGSSDIGAHSNFDALKNRDDNYDILTEVDSGGTPFPITFRAVGTKASGGTTPVSVSLPTGVQVNDLLILVATTIAGGSVSITAAGGLTWTAIPGTPVDVTGGEKLYAWWARYVSGGTAPSVQASTDHVCAGIAAYYNVITSGNPIEVFQTGNETTSDASFEFVTTISTQGPGRMVVVICSSGADSNQAQFSAWANAQLSGVTERADYMTNSGGGGGFGLADGMKSTAGAVGTWTATLATATPKAYVTFALKPQPAPNYELDLEAQWINVDYDEENEYFLCIKTGTLDNESLKVDVWNGNSWITVISSLSANTWNNVSVSPYLTSSTFTIRFKAANETDDTTQSSWQIDCVLLRTCCYTYRLEISNLFKIDLSTYPLSHVYGVEILVRYNVSVAVERWFIKAYDWSSRSFIGIGFNNTEGDHPVANEWNDYAISINENWTRYIRDDGTIQIMFCDEGTSENQTLVQIDFIGVRVILNGLILEIKNSGATTAHIVSIWVINATHHMRNDADFFINSGEKATYIRVDISQPAGNFTVKIVTERGNIDTF